MKKNPTALEMVTFGIKLALTAPSDEKSKQAVDMVLSIATAADFTEREMEAAKSLALAELDLAHETGKVGHG